MFLFSPLPNSSMDRALPLPLPFCEVRPVWKSGEWKFKMQGSAPQKQTVNQYKASHLNRHRILGNKSELQTRGALCVGLTRQFPPPVRIPCPPVPLLLAISWPFFSIRPRSDPLLCASILFFFLCRALRSHPFKAPYCTASLGTAKTCRKSVEWYFCPGVGFTLPSLVAGSFSSGFFCRVFLQCLFVQCFFLQFLLVVCF